MQLRQVFRKVVLVEDFQIFHGFKPFTVDFLLAELTLLVNGDVLGSVERENVKPLKFTVPFDEADGEGIVFFGNYFRLAHRALEQFLPLLGIDWAEWFANSEFGVPLRHVEADYLLPLKPGEEFSVDIKVHELGESSVHFTYEFLTSAGQPIARLKTSHVFVTRNTFQKLPIPAKIRERLTVRSSQ